MNKAAKIAVKMAVSSQDKTQEIESINKQLVGKKSNYQHLVSDIISDAKKLGAQEVAVSLNAGLGP